MAEILTKSRARNIFYGGCSGGGNTSAEYRMGPTQFKRNIVFCWRLFIPLKTWRNPGADCFYSRRDGLGDLCRPNEFLAR